MNQWDKKIGKTVNHSTSALPSRSDASPPAAARAASAAAACRRNEEVEARLRGRRLPGHAPARPEPHGGYGLHLVAAGPSGLSGALHRERLAEGGASRVPRGPRCQGGRGSTGG